MHSPDTIDDALLFQKLLHRHFVPLKGILSGAQIKHPLAPPSEFDLFVSDGVSGEYVHGIIAVGADYSEFILSSLVQRSVEQHMD